MNEMQIFSNPQFGEVRTITRDGEPWFVASDVCKALELSDTNKSVSRLDDDEKGTNSIRTLGGEQQMTIVNESGLYSLVLGSRKPEARVFKRWITHEVLPSIRKSGGYSLVQQRVLTTDDYLKAAAIVATCRNERLGYVVGMLEQGGFCIPRVIESKEQLATELMATIDRASRHGMSMRDIGKLVGIDASTICHYRNGKYATSKARSRYIIDVLNAAISDLE